MNVELSPSRIAKLAQLSQHDSSGITESRNEIHHREREEGLLMVALLIVYRSSMTGDLEEVMRKSGVDAYTIIENATGKGETGNVIGTFFYPGRNSILFAVLRDEQADGIISTLKAFHTERLQNTQGRPIPFKLFSFPCREVI